MENSAMSYLVGINYILLGLATIVGFTMVVYFLGKIQKVALRTAFLVVFISLLSFAMLLSGITLGQRSTRALYVRPIMEITSYLYELSSDGQYAQLHEALTIIHNDLPHVISDNQYTLTDMTLQIFPREEKINGQRIERSSLK
jgi:hypothetical protein